MTATQRRRHDAEALAALMPINQVHRDVYTDPEVLEIGTERRFRCPKTFG